MRKFIILASLLCLNCGFVSKAYAIKVIDARYNMQDALAQYRDAILSSQKRSVRVNIKILVDANRGFNVGYLRLPRRLKHINVRVTLHILRGMSVSKEVSVNVFQLDRKNEVKRINQTLIITG